MQLSKQVNNLHSVDGEHERQHTDECLVGLYIQCRRLCWNTSSL